MLKQILHNPIIKMLLLAVMSVQLVACDGDSSIGSATSVADDVVLAGSVGDGPVTGATIEVWSSSGRLIRSMESDSTASFNSRVRVWRSSYPLLLKVRGGIDLVTGSEPDFQMISVKPDRYTRVVNINPFSTLIVKIAQSLPGGINADNLKAVTEVVTQTLGFGLDPELFPDPIRSLVTDANAASLLKASEALGEMIRRTRDQVAATGRKTSGDAVVAAIAADLHDGSLDGRGAGGTDPRITAVAKVVSGQVLVEVLANTLRVGGIVATTVIDQAIVTTRPGIGSDGMTWNVRVTDGLLQQTQTALAAAGVLDPSAEVIDLMTSVSGITAGALPGDVANTLPADSSRSLDNAIQLSSTADVTELAAVNAAVQTDSGDGAAAAPGTSDPGATEPDNTEPGTTEPGTTEPGTTEPGTTEPGTTEPGTTEPGTIEPGITDPDTSGSVNNIPVISGSPARSVTAGTAYNFQPIASDADGDGLSFSITGIPAWAGFDTSTGRLSGTPTDSDAGTYSDIAIAVSDGTDTASLPAFDISVNPVQVTVGSFSLAWTAPVARADGSPLSLAEIGGYRIHYGPAAGSYPNTVDVTDGSAQQATVNNLLPGTYHVVMTSYDTAGLESTSSAEVVKVAR